MTHPEKETAAQELDPSSLDLVVGGGIAVPEATGGTAPAIKQEQSDKLRGEQLAKAR